MPVAELEVGERWLARRELPKSISDIEQTEGPEVTGAQQDLPGREKGNGARVQVAAVSCGLKELGQVTVTPIEKRHSCESKIVRGLLDRYIRWEQEHCAERKCGIW